MRRSLRRSKLALVFSMLVVTPPRAVAAVLRSHTAIHGDDVKLSDLFMGLLPGQDCTIGPAPAPGQHVVVPATQLMAIASEFGIDWEPSTGYQAANLERKARLVGREEILGVLRPALDADGASAASDISLSAFVSPLLPADMTSPPEIQTLDYDAAGGRFSATLLFQAADLQPMTMRVVGRVTQLVGVLALSHPLPAGAVLSPTDVRIIQLPAASVRGAPLSSVARVTGMALKRPVGDNVPLLDDMLTRPVLVERGRPVILRLEADGLALTAAGTALEAGALGDRIHVMNSLSRAILVGEVRDAADISIEPGSASLSAQGGTVQEALPRMAAGLSGDERRWKNSAQEAQDP